MKKDILKLDYEIFDKIDWQTWEKLGAFKNLFLFSLKDLASNKAYVIGRRGTWKDYVDLYWLVNKKGINLQKIVAEAKKRFAGNFSEKLFYQQLVYWKDIKEFNIEYLTEEINPQEIQRFFSNQVKKIIP